MVFLEVVQPKKGAGGRVSLRKSTSPAGTVHKPQPCPYAHSHFHHHHPPPWQSKPCKPELLGLTGKAQRQPPSLTCTHSLTGKLSSWAAEAEGGVGRENPSSGVTIQTAVQRCAWLILLVFSSPHYVSGALRNNPIKFGFPPPDDIAARFSEQMLTWYVLLLLLSLHIRVPRLFVCLVSNKLPHVDRIMTCLA